MIRKYKSLIEKKMQDPNYRKRFDQRHAAFLLEVQILNALQEKGWSFSDLAKAMHTNRGNISRDLSAGGIRFATVPRLIKLGKALGLRFLPIFVPEKP